MYRDGNGEASDELWLPERIFQPWLAVVGVQGADILGRLTVTQCLERNAGVCFDIELKFSHTFIYKNLCLFLCVRFKIPYIFSGTF